MPIKLQHETRHPRAVRPRTLSIPYGGSPRTRIHAHEQEHKYTYICLQHLDANHFTSNLLEPSPFTHTPRLFLFFLSRYIHINTYPSQLQPQPQKAKTNKTRYLPPPFPSLFTAKQHFPPTFLREKKTICMLLPPPLQSTHSLIQPSQHLASFLSPPLLFSPSNGLRHIPALPINSICPPFPFIQIATADPLAYIHTRTYAVIWVCM